MPQKLFNVNFGRLKADATGPSGVGYTVLDEEGTTVSPRTTDGVYQTAPGIYAAYIAFPHPFSGQVLWDTGDAFDPPAYATEEYSNAEEMVEKIYQMQFGRWEIVNNQMIFYKEDNTTELARFDLFDESGNPSVDSVFKRLRV